MAECPYCGGDTFQDVRFDPDPCWCGVDLQVVPKHDADCTRRADNRATSLCTCGMTDDEVRNGINALRAGENQ